MGYDHALLGRCLEALDELGTNAVREKSVFGMRGLLLGSRIFAAVGNRSLVVRLAPGAYAAAVARPGVRPFMPDGNRLGRWVEIEDRVIADDPDLRGWLAAGLSSLDAG